MGKVCGGYLVTVINATIFHAVAPLFLPLYVQAQLAEYFNPTLASQETKDVARSGDR